MNDPQFLLAAENLSNKIFEESNLEIDDKIIKLYRTITARMPNSIELNKLNQYLEEVKNISNITEKEAFFSLGVLVYNLDETTQKS